MQSDTKNLFDNVTYMVLLLRQSDQVIRLRKSSTCECDGQVAQTKDLSARGLKPTRRRLRHLPASSLSLLATGPSRAPADDGAGSKNRFYSQTFLFAGPTSPPPGPARRRHYQRLGGRGSAAVFAPAPKPWLNGKTSAKSVAKINLCMTACPRKKCRRSITGWSRRRMRIRVKSTPH